MKLWIKMLTGLGAGALVGTFLGPQAALFKPIGTIFLNLVSMIIIPLVSSAIVVGVTNVRTNSQIGHIAIRTFALFLCFMILAAVLGAAVAGVFKPGAGLNLAVPAVAQESDVRPLGETMVNLIPENPIGALVDGNILQVVVFAFFLGIAIKLTGERGRPLMEMFESLSDVLNKLTSVVMEYSPWGIFAITAWISGSFGYSVIYVQFKFLLLYIGTCAFFVFAIFGSLLRFGAKVSPRPLFRGMADAMAFAFSSCSSSSTLPLAMSCLQHKVGVSRTIASFVMPFGAVLNMNGAAIFQGMAAVFLAQAYNIDLGLKEVALLVATSVFSVIGSAGIPGAGFVMVSYVLSVLGLPLEGLILFMGIERVRDMCSTVVNTLGDAVCAVYLARTEGELDERQYYSERLYVLEGDEL